ncbi:hypothetical protein B0A69_16800 [Chryseobacterium shigense]|nr:hypothetical protein B0A69_16800 [Chryseobacterium shigense]
MSIVLFFATGCQNKNEQKMISSVKEVSDTLAIFENNKISDTVINNKNLEEFKREVVTVGDLYSFNRLAIHYEENKNYKELYEYALIMADKYNKGDGCSQVFICIVAMNNKNLYRDILDFAKIDEKAKSDALKYLEKGVRLNDINSASMLQEIYRNGIGVKKDIKKADELKKKIEEM